MNGEPDLVTVFRSADSTAQEDAEDICDLLSEQGLSPVLLSDNAPGVPLGVREVRVPKSEASRADELVASAQEIEPREGDPSHDLDLVTIFSVLGATAEVEALGVKNVLEANGIPTFFVSPPQYPNLRFVVRVPKKFMEQARQILVDAEAAGPAAAEAAERAFGEVLESGPDEA